MPGSPAFSDHFHGAKAGKGIRPLARPKEASAPPSKDYLAALAPDSIQSLRGPVPALGDRPGASRRMEGPSQGGRWANKKGQSEDCPFAGERELTPIP